jgi:hypothetical protein
MGSRVSICIVLLLVSLGAPFVTAADSDYDLALDDTVETPPRTVTLEGDEHTVSAVGRAAPGDTLSVSVTAPSDSSYRVLLYDGDRRIVDSKNGNGAQTVRFDLSGYEPSSYMLAVYENGDYKDVHPLVVEGYDVSVDAPSEAETGSEITVTVNGDKTEDVEDPHAVNVIVANTDQSIRATATEQSGSTYEATISLDELPAGEANVYAVVRGDDSAFTDDRKELLGVSDASTLSIYEPTTTQSSGSQTSTPTETTNRVTTGTESTTTETSSTTSTTTPAPQTSSMTTTDDTAESSETTTTVTTDAVITPGQSTMQETTTSSDSSIPGFGLQTGLVALCCLFYVVIRE